MAKPVSATMPAASSSNPACNSAPTKCPTASLPTVVCVSSRPHRVARGESQPWAGSCKATGVPGCCTAASGCDDNNKCTVDTCEKGQCVATPITCTGSLCEDALCEPQTGVCGLTVKAGKCKIDNTCYDDKDVKADDVCLWCASASNKGGWTLKAVCKCVAGACCDVPAPVVGSRGAWCGRSAA